MPFTDVQGTRIFYRLEGCEENPVLVFSHSLGTDNGMWASQAADLLPHFRILRYDTRGHGASGAPAGDYTIELLGQDLLALADSLGIEQFNFCGLSMGGAIGQWLAINAPDRVTKLVLADTSPHFTPRTNWDNRIRAVREGGMQAVAETVIGRFFSAETLARREPCVGSAKSVLLGTNPVGYLGCCAALRDADFTGALSKIRVPTLVISGDEDVSTPWQGHGEILAREIRGAQSVRLPAAHLSNLERPRSFSAALFGFLLPQSERDSGDSVRRAVLGDEHVDRAQSSVNEFSQDFQDLITDCAWGSVWTRPELDFRTRRLLVLVTMAALGRWEEFSMHVRAGLERELEACDLREALLQTAVYAGVPAANSGFRIALEILENLAAEREGRKKS